MPADYRSERDFLGEKQIPEDAYWGVHTAPRGGKLPDQRDKHFGHARAGEEGRRHGQRRTRRS